MFVTRKTLPRRTFLRGLSATVALPLLDAMVPALKAAPPAPRRLGFVYFPNGAIMDKWIPKSEGIGLELSPTLAPLAPYRDQLVVLGNLARAGTTIGDHAVAAAAWLSGIYAKKTEAEDVLVGPTIDQIVAAHIGGETAFPSLELATEDFTGYIGGCTPGFSCTYMNTLCWTSPTTPVPMEINPRAVFERLFGRAGSAAQRRERQAEDRGILDSVTEEASHLRASLGPRDRVRLSDYLQEVRELEQRIARRPAGGDSAEAAMDAPQGIPESFEEHAALMFDLQKVAYQTDLTRVVTFMLSREASQRTYPQIEVREPHHTISHHGNDPQKKAMNARINLYHVEQFARFVEKLRATPDGDGSLLDHSLIFYGAGMGDGNAHATDPLPLVAVGGLAGSGNRHLLQRPKTPAANLWLGVAAKFGVNIGHLGNSDGLISL
ncbi:MAG: DUF1552 domain-containing protein [Acidobacteriia bacterium]|nr:DUF1552 domain-containing protein [Terriglobia bacterium]